MTALVSDEPAIASTADALLQAYRTRQPGAPPRECLAAGDLDGAYAVQAAQATRWEASGRRLAGIKIGLTGRAIQRARGIDHPVHGRLYADMEIADGDVLAPDTCIQPRVEGEIAFVLSRDLTGEQPGIADVIRAVEFVLPAIEVVDSRVRDFGTDAVDMVADNSAAGAFVLGPEPKSLRGLDLRLCGMVLERNGEPASVGAGLNCLGHPLHALRWAARSLVRQGRPLRAGDLVLTGALGPMVPFAPGDFIDVHISGVGSVSVSRGGENQP